MSSVAVHSALDANLAAIGHTNADVVHMLRAAAPAMDVSFIDTPQQVPAGLLDGRQMCSRHRPLDEAQRLVESVDLVENAVIVVLGFAMGYHVQAIAERMGKAGVIIVYEPDLAIARAVLQRVDHASWMSKTNLIWMTGEHDKATLANKLNGVENILAQGVAFVEHPPSRDRLGQRSSEFSRMLSEYMQSTRTVLLTQLVKAVDAVKNMVANVDHYVSCDGIADLKDAARDCPAVVVSAGPSLHRNMHLLAQPGVRDRVVIIAVQTVLKPLLAAGIKPHFVTALDYHEISARFYENLTAEQVQGVTLVAEPKVHPAVLDAFPGKTRCVSAKFLNDLLGSAHDREMGELTAGTTVAHLAAYLAQHLGCSTIAMIGQDLAFTDGLYYSPGTAIDDVWSPELNAFNTMEMMQWQRIVRHRQHLSKLHDARGRAIYTDAQMSAYLQQFERDFAAFAAKGITVIDATEGGAAKKHTTAMPLADVLKTYAANKLPEKLGAAATVDDQPAPGAAQRVQAAHKRLSQMRREIAELRETSRRTHRLIEQMLTDQTDSAKMKQHFAKLQRFRDRVTKLKEAFKVLEYLNQLGSFNRRKADRRLHMQQDLSPMQRQKLELQRDAENVAWIQDAADQLIDHLTKADRRLGSQRLTATPSTSPPQASRVSATASDESVQRANVAALVPIDPQRNGLGEIRSLADHFNGASVLQVTLKRLAASRTLQRIILIAPQAFDVEPLIDRKSLPLPVEIERCDGDSPFGPEHRAIAAARAFCDTAWRGGIGNITVYDEVLCPQIMHEIMARRGLAAALIAGPDWTDIDVTSAHGCDALVQRFAMQGEAHPFIFTQAPPGMCGCVISTDLMKQLAHRNRLATIGSVLGYQPQSPRVDAIGTDACVQIPPDLRNATARAIYPRHGTDARATPHHLILELTTERQSSGLFHQRLREAAGEDASRPAIALEAARNVIDHHIAEGCRVLSLAGVGDPLLHEQCDEIIRFAKDAGMAAVHVRTQLLASREVLDRLLASEVDVISVDLHADSPETYRAMLGCDRFGEVLENMQYLLERRTRLSEHPPTAAIALPWLVMRMQRCAQTYRDMESFFDRWQHVLGTAVLEGVPTALADQDALDAAVTPQRVVQRHQRERIVIRCDGSTADEQLARLFLP